ncbi:MAG TPA: hypothetical protein VN903_12055, partial [Polyangia bacterium]|nr:hypothetical protein [Polyangia bacterium]
MNRTSNEPFALAAGKLPTWIWIVVLVPAACAVDDRNPGVAGTAACDAIEQGNIERSVACSGISRDALTTARKAFDPCTLVAASQAAGALATDEATLTACLNDLATAVCGVETPRCRQALVGKLGEGAPCYPLANWEECAPGYHCMMDSCPGTCVRYAQLGEACSLDSSLGPACDPSLYCDGNASTCVAPIGPPTVNVGDSCSPYGCNNLVCKGPNGPLLVSDPNMPGTCQPASANGPCNYATDCIGRCVGATPPSTPGVCMPWRQIGDTCRPGAGECSRG